MQALWHIEKGFIKDILATLPEDNHYNTVSTIVRNLEEKGFIDHKAYGKTHEYYPMVSRDKYFKEHFKTLIKN